MTQINGYQFTEGATEGATVNLYVGLYVGLIYEGVMDPVQRDALTMAYCAGVRATMRDEQVAAIRWSAQEARRQWPDAEVVEVRVTLSSGVRDFTWDEFTAWVAGAP